MTEFSGVSLPWLYTNIGNLSKSAVDTAMKKFLAARTIQKYFRGYMVRKTLAERIQAAIKIQKMWRGQLGRRRFYDILESKVDMEALGFYYTMATRIQSLFRGYYYRKYVHDHYKLKKYQNMAAKDLITCIAFKLHHMIRTYQIPGVYSIRNSKCLSKIEQLLSSMRFKEYNEVVRRERLRANKRLDDVKQTTKANLDYSQVPYGSMCDQVWNQPDAERKMHEMLKNYVAPKPPVEKARPEEGFCAEIVKSLHKWKIIDQERYIINPNVVKNPKNVEGFVDEIQSACELRGIHSQCFTK